MFRVYWLRSLWVVLLVAGALGLSPGALAQVTPQVCDVDGDADIDKVDITLIANARGQTASGPTDPRDPDRDNTITSADARTCTQRCTFAECASPTNRPPIANAGPDQTVSAGQQVTLDGSSSSDPDGDPLTFRWTLAGKPAGSNAVLTGATTVSPGFTPDVPGAYLLRLIVNDGQVDSQPDTALVTTGNAPPVADAGDDQTPIVNSQVTLDGSGSSDINGDPLTYSWSFLQRPAGSAATLSSSTAVMPTFTPDRTGTYRLRLIVNDGQVNSPPDVVEIRTLAPPNEPPLADAGPDQTVDLNATVTLDGSDSFDPDAGPSPLTYCWSLLTKPAGSSAVVSTTCTTSPTRTFMADKAGEYVVQLIVNDGAASSAADTVRITTRNTRPIADAGDDQSRNVGDTVALDGTGSFDANGDDLSYQWSFTSRPNGSAATIANPQIPTSSFVADLPGLYVVQLVVNDGQFDSAPDTATVTVIVPTVPALSINNASITEGNSGTKTLSFTVTLAPAATGAVTVNYATADGTATTAGSDYTAKSASLTYTAGQTSKTVTVTIRGDITFEPDENFFVNLSNASANATIADAQGVGTIANDDTAALPVVTITAPDSTATEAGPTSGQFAVARTGATTGSLTVNLSIGGTASNGDDYQSVAATLTIPAGATSAPLVITPINDAIDETEETVIVIVAPSAGGTYTVGSPPAATVKLADDDALPTVSIVATDASASEPGTNTGTFTVSRAGPTTFQISVQLTLSGTATSSADYVGFTAVAVIPAGQSTKTITVTPRDDQSDEPDETVVLTINPNPTLYLVGTPDTATVTIADDDTAALPTISVAATDANASEQGLGTGTFTISRTGSSLAAPLTVLHSIGGTANPATSVDYNGHPGGSTLIPAGASTATITITPVDDATVEDPPETVTLTITANAAYVVATPPQNTASITIADNDSFATVSVAATDANASEQGLGTGTFTISRTGSSLAAPLTVLHSIGGTANPATSVDYNGHPGGSTLIPAGASTATITITPVDDATVEDPPETVTLTITANAAYVVATPPQNTASITIADNDSFATVSVAATDANASEQGLGTGTFTISRTGSSLAAPLTVLHSIGGTANPATSVDYNGHPGGSTLIPAGASTATITITPVDDATVEDPPETVTLTITANAAYVVATPPQNTASITIADNDSFATVSVAATDANASEQGLGTGTFTISRTGSSLAAPLTVLHSIGGTANPATSVDYNGHPGGSTLIPAGASTATITITPVDDATVEDPPETVTLTITANAAYVVATPPQNTASITIADNDAGGLPTVKIEAQDANAAEAGQDPGVMRITRSGGNNTLALVVPTTRGGTADNASDYASVGSTFTIPAGAAFVDVTFTPVDDPTPEPAETITVTLNNDPDYVIGSPNTATVTIALNDSGALMDFSNPVPRIGQNLQVTSSVRILSGTAPAGGLSLRLVSNSPNLLLSANPLTAGAQTLDITIPANQTQPPAGFFLQSLAASGTANVTIQVLTTPNPGFENETPLVATLVPAGFYLVCYQGPPGACGLTATGYALSTPAAAGNTLLYLQAEALNPAPPPLNGNRLGPQDVRGGLTIPVALALSNSNLGVFRARNPDNSPGGVITQLPFAGDDFEYFFFDPNNSGSGSGTIGFTPPPGAGTPLTNNGSGPYSQTMPVTVTP